VSVETATANVRVNIQNSRFANVNSFGVESAPTAGNVILSLDNDTFVRSGQTAIVLRSNTAAILNRVSVTAGANAAVSLEQSTASAHISNSLFTNNVFGVFNGNGGGAPTTRLYGTVITGSTSSALSINGGQVISYGNNAIRGNAGNEAPSSNSGTQ
jgi:hypothetical protein